MMIMSITANSLKKISEMWKYHDGLKQAVQEEVPVVNEEMISETEMTKEKTSPASGANSKTG